jgi:hypothetical protein
MATVLESTTRVSAERSARRRLRAADGALLALLAAAMAALWGRILAYPLQHDEQFYIPAGVLFSWQGLYDQLGFSHLPNLALLLHALYALPIGDHYLLAGRLLVCAAWGGAVAVIVALGRFFDADRLTLTLMVALLITHPLLLGPTGMATTNNFIPVPLLLFGLLAFLKGVERVDWSWCAWSGLFLSAGAGFKANYALLVVPFGIAMLLVAPRPGWRACATAFFAGALIAALPTLYFLARPASFAAHILTFQRGPQIAFWLAHPDPADPKILSLRGKLLLAQQLWFGGASMVLVLAGTTLAFAAGKESRSADAAARLSRRAALLGALLLIGIAVAFVPTPAFPQYYALPIPLGVVALAALRQRLDGPTRRAARPLLLAALAITLLAGTPTLLANSLALAQPTRWAGLTVHADAARLARVIPGDKPAALVATLSPIYPLEAAHSVLPQLGLGPFIYRAIDYASAETRSHFIAPLSPTTIEPALWKACPAAILAGLEGELDAPLLRFADAAHYARFTFTLRGPDRKAVLLLIRPPLGCPRGT